MAQHKQHKPAVILSLCPHLHMTLSPDDKKKCELWLKDAEVKLNAELEQSAVNYLFFPAITEDDYCIHGKYKTDYCLPCGRTNGGG